MNVSRTFHQSIQVKPFVAGAEDAYGNLAEGFGATVTYEGRLEQTEAIELRQGRDTLISTHLLMLPPDAVITGRSQVVYDGQTFEVIGDPGEQVTTRGETTHLEGRLVVVE